MGIGLVVSCLLTGYATAMKLTFKILCVPIGKGRPRVTARGKFAHAYTPKKTKDYEKFLKAEAATAMTGWAPLTGPLKVDIQFTMPIPKSVTKKGRELMLTGTVKHTKKPDSDNLAKSVLDALNGVVWEDDSLIYDLHVTKYYGAEPGIIITVVTE